MTDRPFTEKIAALNPQGWERFVRAAERERHGEAPLFRVTCTCLPPELLACAYCRCEAFRLERLHREIESFVAMKMTLGEFVGKRSSDALPVENSPGLTVENSRTYRRFSATQDEAEVKIEAA